MHDMVKKHGNKFKRDIYGKYQFNITSPNSTYYIWLSDDTKRVMSGKKVTANYTKQANVIITVSDSDFYDIAHNKLDSLYAFMRGKILVKGDKSYAKNLKQIFAISLK
jgi:putative sterol carrier protein